MKRFMICELWRMLAFVRFLHPVSPRLQKLNRAFKDQLDQFDACEIHR